MQLSKTEVKQYSRHLLLDEVGITGQVRLKKARVLVIGAGGLGCPVLQYLTAAGVGTIGVVDHDTIDQTNLQRQILYTHDDIGHYKAELVKTRLSALNPFVDFDIYIQRLDSSNAVELFNKYDIIVDATDNFPTRYLVNDAAVLTNKPVISASIYKFEGQLSVFNYRSGPTYRCLYPNPPLANTITNCSAIGVLGVLPGIIGSLQANEVIKIICKLGNILSGKLLTFDALSLEQTIFSFHKNEKLKISALDHDYAFFCGVQQSVLEMTLNELQACQEDYFLLDIRAQTDRDIHNIGGLHIPLAELTCRFTELPENINIVVYCKTGINSQFAIRQLRQKGLKNTLISLKGGITAQI